MKDIYKFFNDTDINTNEYDDIELTASEVEKYKEMVSQKIYIRKRPIYRQVAALIVFSILSFLLLNTSHVSAILDSFGKNLKDILKISENKDFDNYNTKINETVSDNNISVAIEEVLIEENQLIVSSTIDYSNLAKDLKDELINTNRKISIYPFMNIDNVEYMCATSFLLDISDDKIRYITIFNIEDLSKSKILNCSLYYKFYTTSFKDKNNDYLDKEIQGNWAFDFSLNTSNIVNSQKELSLNSNNILHYKNGDTLKINKIDKSDISIKIYHDLTTKSNYYSVPPFFLIDSNNIYLPPVIWNNEYSLFFIGDSSAANSFTVSGYDHGASENIIIDLDN